MAGIELDEQFKDLSNKVKDLDRTMVLVVIVLFVGFITMLVGFVSLIDSSNGNKQASYQQLELEVQQLNDKMK